MKLVSELHRFIFVSSFKFEDSLNIRTVPSFLTWSIDICNIVYLFLFSRVLPNDLWITFFSDGIM